MHSRTGAGRVTPLSRATIVPALLMLAWPQLAASAKPDLKCRPDGTFKVVMFSDQHFDSNLDQRATALMETILDEEKPDMVVAAGDCVSGPECRTPEQLRQAISRVADPMEKRRIPWAIVFGNHDQEHFPNTKIGKEEVIAIYAGYPCNLNKRGPRTIHGVGNDCLIVENSAGDKPVLCLWLIDSNDYAPEAISKYDWIHTDQVWWYYNTSKDMESRYGRKIPGIMFFHIPPPEFIEMASTGKIDGDRCEPGGASKVNGGLLAAVLERGDVKGIFCGHDHTNNYVGTWKGVKLGYDAAVGYSIAYNLPGTDPRSVRTRGGRVFLISESDPWSFKTWMRFSDGSTSRAQ